MSARISAPASEAARGTPSERYRLVLGIGEVNEQNESQLDEPIRWTR